MKHLPEAKHSIAVIMLLNWIGTCKSFGEVDYNDDCDFPVTDTGSGTALTSDLREWKMCNTERGLYCIPGLGRCGCYVPHSIYRSGKCRAKVNNACLSLDNVRIDCVVDAICNNTGVAWKCQCKRGYLSNWENTSCFPASEATREWRDYRNCRYNSYWSSSPPYWCNQSNINHSANFILMTTVMYLLLLVSSTMVSGF